MSVEVKKSQHHYVIGLKGSGLTEILAATAVSVEILLSDNVLETITLRGDLDKLGPALTMVYAKVTTLHVASYNFFPSTTTFVTNTLGMCKNHSMRVRSKFLVFERHSKNISFYDISARMWLEF